MPGCFPHHTNDSARKGFAEHNPGSSGFDCSEERLENLVRSSGDMRGEDQPEATALILCELNRFNCTTSPLTHRGIVEFRIKILIFLNKHEERRNCSLFDQFTNFLRCDTGGRFENRAEGRLVRSEPCKPSQPQRTMGRARKCCNDPFGNL